MEDVENTNKVVKNGFINHVFNFDNETKNDLMNIIQYIVLALIPCSLANHFVDSIIPEVDDSKSNLELSVEQSSKTSISFFE